MTTTPTTRKISKAAQRVLDLAVHDPQLQELMPDEVVLAEIARKDQTLAGIVEVMLDGYATRPALGERVYDVVTDGSGRQVRAFRPEFETVTYGELARRARAIATVWTQVEGWQIAPGQTVLTFGFASTDYVVLDLACMLAQGMAVPLQTTLAGQDLSGIVRDVEPVVIAATTDDLLIAAEYAASSKGLHTLVAFDYDQRIDADREQWTAAEAALGGRVRLVTVEQLMDAGSGRGWSSLPPVTNEKQMALLVHSSGSTGAPKGAIVTEQHARFQFQVLPPVPLPTVRLCFAPMNHFMGRGAVYNTMARGGTAYFIARSDMSTLFEDLQLVRPTEAVVFPRVLDMAHRHFLNEVARRTAAEPEPDVEEIRQRVMAEMRYTYLGDRISMLYGGSAPSTPEVRQFIKDCFPVGYAEGYGTTEAGGSVTVRDRINRAEVLDYRLRDVPELGYYSTDKPYPRGELCVKTRLAIPGYFKNPEATAKLFDEDGYVMTGDIMEERGPDHLVYIDRRNDVLKLAHGEFVTLGAVGNAFETNSDVIQQIFVYGSSERSFLVAVVVPEPQVVAIRLGENPSETQIKELIRAEFARVAASEKLRSFEVPRDFIVEHEAFSQANGLLSSVSKRMRPRLLERYGDRLEQIYEDLEAKQNADLLALRDPDSDLSVSERVARALAATLGLDQVDPADRRSFAEAGGDSLGAAAFAALLSDIFDVPVDINAILSPAGHVGAWVAAIERERDRGTDERPTVVSVHGSPQPRELAGADLDIVRLQPQLADAPAPAAAADATRTVLLTGATGFLGRFQLVEWLERTSAVGGRVICLVRGRDQADADARLRANFAADGDLAARIEQLSPHLEVLVGDVAVPRLGLDGATWERLADTVDRIVHPGALVNHVLEYEYLFGPNVMGTAELIALAVTGRLKRFDFVSSMAVIPFLERGATIDESTPLGAEVTIKDYYSAHYGASKWAAESVLLSAHERFGLPVTVFRGDMMLPHRTFRGQVNVPDVFVRLLQSLVLTGLAPASFYEPAGARAHYDGLPVDFIAAATAAVAIESGDGFHTYHVTNPHNDGISLDTMVDWIEAAGYRIERVEGYEEWVRRFETALQALPDEQRQRSSLGVLDSLRRPDRAGVMPVDSTRFVEAVRRSASESDVPHLTARFIAKWLDDLAGLDLIPAPVVAG
ncbi:thioester reductase domain-containing protein [Gordonia polyisoprenivorans]|uniref:thioester reductase domain-containing protein n=1 Tax=Gordonia polyisoprenivorans TaxID=84595 RepID=UPI001AD74D55|nr:thioester reductase domain-containing protein [Gordonia polyisoprenivorans]QTI70985.1 thioester reductase domain-containing protein [Gordonia polyisoprenivorans]